MEGWNDFYVAVAGAAAALTGLIFVAVSIGLKKILSIPTLPNRALISLVLLLSILLFSIIFLVPRQSIPFLGYEVCLMGAIVWLIVTKLDINIYATKQPKYRRHYRLNMLANQLASLPYIVGGVCILSIGEQGIFWIVPAIIFSFIKAVIDAWVLLIEINR